MDGAIVNPITAILLMALVTYLTRAVPMAFFRREIGSPYVKAFFRYMPFAVLGALTFPDIFTAAGSVVSSTAGCAVAVLLALRGKSMIFVTVSAIVTVYAVGLIF
ncbi:MAG TPA: AzlD domain-containing protein [Limnochordia bacterium]|nr:AzlD domain-containing protein [Bacillota bacterium]HKM16898.1 AzlD domain-containing protein [Limnochordia bacterium]